METSLTNTHNNSSLIHNFLMKEKKNCILYLTISLLLIKVYEKMITGILRYFSILKITCFVAVIKESKAKMNENQDE